MTQKSNYIFQQSPKQKPLEGFLLDKHHCFAIIEIRSISTLKNLIGDPEGHLPQPGGFQPCTSGERAYGARGEKMAEKKKEEEMTKTLICCYELNPGQYEIQRGHNPLIVEEINNLLFGKVLLKKIKKEMAKYWLETRKKLANLTVNRVFWEPNGEDVSFAEYLTGYPDLKQIASNLKVLVERNPEDIRYRVLLDLVNQGAKPTCLHDHKFVDLRDYIVTITIQIYQLEQNLEYLELSEEEREQKKTKPRNALDELRKFLNLVERPPITSREAALNARLPELIDELENLDHTSKEVREMMYKDSHIRRRSLNAASQEYKKSYESHLEYIAEEIDRYLLEGETGVLIGKIAFDDQLQARLQFDYGIETIIYPLPTKIEKWDNAMGKDEPIFELNHPPLCPVCKEKK